MRELVETTRTNASLTKEHAVNRIRRMLISFCVVLNLVGFGLIVLVLANTGALGDVVLMASSDAILLLTIALCGLVFNLLLAIALWRGSLRTRRLEAELRGIRTEPI